MAKDAVFLPVTNASVMALPHPARMVPTMGPFFDAFSDILGSEWPFVVAELSNEDLVLPEILRRLTNEMRLPRFTQIIATSTSMPGGYGAGRSAGDDGVSATTR